MIGVGSDEWPPKQRTPSKVPVANQYLHRPNPLSGTRVAHQWVMVGALRTLLRGAKLHTWHVHVPYRPSIELCLFLDPHDTPPLVE